MRLTGEDLDKILKQISTEYTEAQKQLMTAITRSDGTGVQIQTPPQCADWVKMLFQSKEFQMVYRQWEQMYGMPAACCIITMMYYGYRIREEEVLLELSNLTDTRPDTA